MTEEMQYANGEPNPKTHYRKRNYNKEVSCKCCEGDDAAMGGSIHANLQTNDQELTSPSASDQGRDQELILQSAPGPVCPIKRSSFDPDPPPELGADGHNEGVPLHNNDVKWGRDEADEVTRDAVNAIYQQNGMSAERNDNALARFGINPPPLLPQWWEPGDAIETHEDHTDNEDDHAGWRGPTGSLDQTGPNGSGSDNSMENAATANHQSKWGHDRQIRGPTRSGRQRRRIRMQKLRQWQGRVL